MIVRDAPASMLWWSAWEHSTDMLGFGPEDWCGDE